MRAWLETMLLGVCTLRLNTTFEPAWNDASFHWTAQNLTDNSFIEIRKTDPIGAEIVLPEESNLAGFRPAMQAYYSLVGEVRWCGIGNAGRLFKGTGHSAIFVGEVDEESRLHWESVRSRALDPRETFQFGSCDNGTPLTYTRDGKAGLWGFPARDKGFTQTMEDVVNWVYSELLAGRRPAGLD
jgi:hypothetical protein